MLAIDQHPAGFHFQQTLLRLPRQAATTWKLGGWRSGLITRAVSDNQHDKGNNYQPQDPRQGQQAHPQRAVPRLHMHPQNTGGSISGLLPVEAAEYGAHDFLVSEEAGTQFHHTNPPWKDAPQARMTGNVAARAGREFALQQIRKPPKLKSHLTPVTARAPTPPSVMRALWPANAAHTRVGDATAETTAHARIPVSLTA